MSRAQEDVSVIICAYTEKRWHDLCEAVASVQRQTIQSREIIVVIDHNPTLLRRVKKHMSAITVIENSATKGLSGARNSGAAIARGSIIAFLDDDAIAEPDWVEQLLIPYNDLAIVGVGGRINPFWLENRPSWFPEEFNWVVGCTYRGMPKTMAPIRNMIGANMSLRRETLMAIGGFREAFGCNHENTSKHGNQFSSKWLSHNAGDEETELCIRATHLYQNKVKIFYAPTAIVRHRVTRQRTRWSYFLWRCYDEGIGKASLVALHGTEKSLASERAYTLKTLPQGILQGVVSAFFRRDITGFARAGAIVAGLAATTAGYIVGCISTKAVHEGKRIHIVGEKQLALTN